LRQNYPNPFNPATIVTYSIPAEQQVRVYVYDILGREVAALVNERVPAGVHTVRFDGVGLSSGVYIYRITAGDFMQTRRMMLLR